jgi:hypothetical protein
MSAAVLVEVVAAVLAAWLGVVEVEGAGTVASNGM